METNNCIVLPSGSLINIDDIIYMSPIAIKNSDEETRYEFNIIWAHRIEKTLRYQSYHTAEMDWDFIKKNI